MRFPKDPKTKGKIEDRTGYDFYRAVAIQPSSAYPLTQREIDMKDAGWSDHDLYFLRAAQSDGDLPPNKSATYFSGEDARARKEAMIQRQFEKIMKQKAKR